MSTCCPSWMWQMTTIHFKNLFNKNELIMLHLIQCGLNAMDWLHRLSIWVDWDKWQAPVCYFLWCWTFVLMFILLSFTLQKLFFFHIKLSTCGTYTFYLNKALIPEFTLRQEDLIVLSYTAFSSTFKKIFFCSDF